MRMCKNRFSVPGQIPAENLKRLITSLERSKDEEWSSLWLRVMGSERSYVTDYTRADFKFLLPINKDAVVLEVGSSMGQICLNIAPSVKKVFGTEIGEEQCKICSLLAQRRGLGNLEITRVEAGGKLPYQDCLFDIVLLNNTIEWIGSGRSFEEALLAQKTIFSEIKRVLKTGGAFYVSTKNRYAMQYLIGDIDEHFNIRFGSALPRFLLEWIRKKRSARFTGLLHSVGGLKKLSKDAGLDVRETYWAIPDVRTPKYYIPLTNEMISYARNTYYICDRLPRKYRFLIKILPAALFKNFIYSFAIAGTKSGT